MAWKSKWIPRDVEPAGASKELIGIFPFLEEIYERRKLGRIFGTNIGCLADEVLRAVDTTHQTINSSVAETRVDDDGTDHMTGRFQQEMATIGHVCHVSYALQRYGK